MSLLFMSLCFLMDWDGGVVFTAFQTVPTSKLNFSIFSLPSHYCICERRIHSSYTHICGTGEKGITLIDFQLLCFWKIILVPDDLELFVLPSMKGNQLVQIFLDSWFHHITSFCHRFPHRVGNCHILSLFRQVSDLMIFVIFCVWLSGNLLCLFLFLN